MLTNLTPPPFCGPIILHKKQATDFFYIQTCNWNLRFLSIAVTVHINKQRNQTVIIDHLKINCGQSQTAWNFSPDYTALGLKSLVPSDGGLQPTIRQSGLWSSVGTHGSLVVIWWLCISSGCETRKFDFLSQISHWKSRSIATKNKKGTWPRYYAPLVQTWWS